MIIVDEIGIEIDSDSCSLFGISCSHLKVIIVSLLFIIISSNKHITTPSSITLSPIRIPAASVPFTSQQSIILRGGL